MISFESFKKFTPNLQAKVLWEYGIFLDLVRQTPESNVELYSLFDFYVEIYFDKNTGDPLFLRSFSNTNALEPYLPVVEIDSIFETN